MKGTIEQISKETSKKGNEYLRVKINGEKYSVWDSDFFDVIREGDEVDFEYKESGQWKNITEIVGLNVASETGNEREIYIRSKDRRIARMSCVKSAAYVLANADLDASEKGDKTISLAKNFEKYLYEDDHNTDTN